MNDYGINHNIHSFSSQPASQPSIAGMNGVWMMMMPSIYLKSIQIILTLSITNFTAHSPPLLPRITEACNAARYSSPVISSMPGRTYVFTVPLARPSPPVPSYSSPSSEKHTVNKSHNSLESHYITFGCFPQNPRCWTLIANFLPSPFFFATCTCASDADAIGSISNSSNISSG